MTIKGEYRGAGGAAENLRPAACLSAAHRQFICRWQIDLPGINYYQPRRVKCRDTAVNPQAPFMPSGYLTITTCRGRKMNPYRGCGKFTRRIYDIITNLRDNYGNPRCFISENGWALVNEQRFVQATGDSR